MKIVKLNKGTTEKIINSAASVLKKGGLVIYPTETCYGIAADTTNQSAVSSLIKYKGERRNKPISIAVNNKKMAQKYIFINKTADNLYKNFLPGALTVVSRGKHKVDYRLESKEGTLGIRIPKVSLVLQIIKKFGKPITATSANISNARTPYRISDILDYLSPKKKAFIDLIIDAGKLPKNPPSTVVDTTLNEINIIRQGTINFNKLSTKRIITNSEIETKEFAQKLIKNHFKYLNSYCIIFALQGELGTGKTQFCKGLGLFLKIKKSIASPTFILLKEYPFDFKDNKKFFYHIDTWRMKDNNELKEIGFQKMIKPGNIIAIEWLQKAKIFLDSLKKNNKVKIVWIEIKYGNNINQRKINYYCE